jgi:hypothetical protein
VCDPRLARVRFVLAGGHVEGTLVVRAEVRDVGSNYVYASCEDIKEGVLGCTHPLCTDEQAAVKITSFDGKILRLNILGGDYAGSISLILSGNTLSTKDVYKGFELVFKKVPSK